MLDVAEAALELPFPNPIDIRGDPKPAAYHFRVHQRSMVDSGARHTADSKQGLR